MPLSARSPAGQSALHQSASALTTALRRTGAPSVLEFFNADPDEYVVIFTANATQALKLVGEAYPFDAATANTADVRQPQLGQRHSRVRARKAMPDDLRAGRAAGHAGRRERAGVASRRRAARAATGCSRIRRNRIFPACSIRSTGFPLRRSTGWDVLLDAAAFTPTNRLDLRRWKPDFVSQSFYKMFGIRPAWDVSIARKAALAKLQRPWFAGGTITVASVQGDRFYLAEGEAGFEDGTPNYLALPAIEIGLQYIAEIGIDTIHTRVRCLTGWLIERLDCARHSNGTALARIYGPRSDMRRGGTVTFNLYDPRGTGHRSSRRRAARERRGHLAAHRLLLQSGRRRNRARHHRHRAVLVLHQPEHETHLTLTISGCASTARAPGRCGSRSGWRRTSLISTRSSASPTRS